MSAPPVFMAALFSVAETWKQPEYPLMVERMKELRYIYLQ